MKRKFLWALLCSFTILLFCTKASPLYPINDWSDANIYLTIGKGMTRGQVVYRDLYDHKGPLLYALHAICALISFSDFTGVFVMEVLLGATFLYAAQELMEEFGAKRLAWALAPVLALLIFSSTSFSEGDSAEEICLPLMMLSTLGVCRGKLNPRDLLWQGFLAGCVFWTKFTLIGVQAGLLLWVLFQNRKAILPLAGGFLLSTVPWLIYFGLNGAIADWLKVYLYDNLFLYSAGESAGMLAKIKDIAKSVLSWLTSNLRYTLPMAVGLALVPQKLRAPVWLSMALGTISVFIGGKSYAYYGLALGGFSVWGLIALGRYLNRSFRALPAVMLAACVALCPLISYNMTADYGAPFGSKREDTMQYQIARHIPEDASLLNFGFMDAGFFTAAGLTPQVKYFHRTNVPLEEMISEQYRYLREKLCDYVITRSDMPPEGYELVAQADSPNFWYDTVYLYRVKEEP